MTDTGPTVGHRRRVDTRCIACKATLIIRVPRGGKSWTAADAAEMERGDVCGDCAGPYTFAELDVILRNWRDTGELPPRLAAKALSASRLTGARAEGKLKGLGFSGRDVPGLLQKARRMAPLPAAGLTSLFHVAVSYYGSRYSVKLSALDGCTCDHCRMTGRVANPEVRTSRVI
jgi:hypothetical protein